MIALLAALAITIHILESAFPRPLPGIKPGLANVITLVTFLLFDWKSALQVSLLRVVIGSLVLGTFLSPTFLLSLSGACMSLAALLLIRLLFPGRLAILPLNVDLFTKILFLLRESKWCDGFTGVLDSNGTGHAALYMPPAPGLAGGVFSFAFALRSPFDFVSNLLEVDALP